MTTVTLTGELHCRTEQEAQIVREHLPLHLELTRAEAGCLRFEVTATPDPRVWRVRELFADAASFRAHQARVAASGWGRVTAGIPRHYAVSGLEDTNMEG